MRGADKKCNIHYTKAAFVSEDPDSDTPEILAKLLAEVGATGQKTEQRIMGLTGSEVDKVRGELLRPPATCMQHVMAWCKAFHACASNGLYVLY